MSSSENIMPQPDVLNELEYGRFVLTNLAAARAKQLREGAPPLVRIQSGHPLTQALAEIAAGKIKPILPGDPKPVSEPGDRVSPLLDDITTRFVTFDDPLLDEGSEERLFDDFQVHDLDFDGDDEDEPIELVDEPPTIAVFLDEGVEDDAAELVVDSDEVSLEDMVSKESAVDDEDDPDLV